MKKSYILVDSQDIVRCHVEDPRNFHQAKLDGGMKPYGPIDFLGRVGDEYLNGVTTPRPANYPPKTDEQKIQNEIEYQARENAVTALKNNGKLPPSFNDNRGRPQ